MLGGCIPPGASTAPESVSTETPAAAPQLALDLKDLKDVQPSWEMRPVTAAAVDVRASTYVVKPGDTLRAIGEATGAGSEAIARANNLVAPFVVKPGQSLTIPGGRYHRVREGETGIAISRAYGLPWRAIIEANALTEPFTLRVGQRLLLPGQTAGSSTTTAASLEARAAAFQIGIDDVVTGSEPAGTAEPPPSPKPATGVASAPVRFAWPVGGAIVSRFGPQGSGRINQGIDIAAPLGAGIRAASAGTIAYVGTGVPGYGGLILVRHDGGWISAYGRIASTAVTKGDTVHAGQTLGKSNGEPLHFELRRARVPVDPIKYLPTR
jgi:murein DD-endopeptidase MepM/ murein hydrolase activator NlpD